MSLVDLWRAWDKRPGEREPAIRLDDELTRVAADLGLTGSELRDRITARRRNGTPLDDAIAEATTP